MTSNISIVCANWASSLGLKVLAMRILLYRSGHFCCLGISAAGRLSCSKLAASLGGRREFGKFPLQAFADQPAGAYHRTLLSHFDTGRRCMPLRTRGGSRIGGGCFQHRRLAPPLRSGLSQVRSLFPGAPVTKNPLSQDHPMRHTGRELMKMPLLLLIGCAALATRGENLPERYADYGELIVTQLASAPFPHPKRAEGYIYQGQLYAAKEHYWDNTVAIFIPKGFRETGQVDFVVHFPAWKNNVEGVLRQYRLIEQLSESGGNAVLVVPQGPLDAPDSFGGKLEDAGGFKRFMADVVETLRQKSALKKKGFAMGQIVLAGHSGGYEVISAIVDCGGLTERVREVWLFDALYAQTDKFLAWIDRHQGRFLRSEE